LVDIGEPGGYVRSRGTLSKLQIAGEIQLRFEASNLRIEKTGLHSKIGIFANGVCVAYNTFNVERDEDRVRLANSAYTQLAPSEGKDSVVPGYPKKYMKNDLDRFCAGLQEAFVDGQQPSPMRGSLVRREPRFVLKPYLLYDSSSILYAPPGEGKSYVLWLMAVCIDAGLPTLWQVEKTPALVVNLERPAASVEDRLGNINQIFGLARDRPIHTLNGRGKTLEAVAPAIQKYVDREGIGVILLDSLSRAGKGSLVDDDVVNAYCDILNGFGPAWLSLAHSPRGDSSHVFGSQMFDAAADLMVRLTSQTRLNGTMGIGLDLTKRNDIGPQPMWIGAFAFDKAGLIEARRARPGEFPGLEGAATMPEEERVARYLGRVGAASATTVSRDLGLNRSNVSTMFNTNDRFAFVRKEHRDVLYGLAVGNTSGGQHMGNTSEAEELPF
jgi:AAA domain